MEFPKMQGEEVRSFFNALRIGLRSEGDSSTPMSFKVKQPYRLATLSGGSGPRVVTAYKDSIAIVVNFIIFSDDTVVLCDDRGVTLVIKAPFSATLKSIIEVDCNERQSQALEQNKISHSRAVAVRIDDQGGSRRASRALPKQQ